MCIRDSFNALASPQFALRGTGFAVGDGNLVATNAHVLAQETEQKTPGASETTTELVVHVRRPGGEWQLRRARVLAVDPIHDLALLRFEGAPVPKLTLRDSSAVREGQNVAFIGFPLSLIHI